MNRFALAISHLPHRVNGSDLPILMAIQAIEIIANCGGILVGSFGAVQWNVQLAQASRKKVPVELIVPDVFSEAQIQQEFPSLNIVSITFVDSETSRDRELLFRADNIFPIWCRSKGRIAKLLTELDQSKLHNDYDCSSYRFTAVQKSIPRSCRPEISQLPHEYLWHWSRSSDEPWPNESMETFCCELIDSRTYPRSAVQTLRRIVTSKVLLGSGVSIGGGEPVVCFTENHPSQMNSHFVWRIGKHRMNFEPYAIGFPREYLESRGAVPVRYDEKARWDSMHRSDRWRSEREWRIRGDLDFSEVEKMMIVIVLNESQRKLFGEYSVIAYEE